MEKSYKIKDVDVLILFLRNFDKNKQSYMLICINQTISCRCYHYFGSI